MPRRILATAVLGALALGPIWSGCAVQRDLSATGTVMGAEAGQDGGGGMSAGSAGKAGAPVAMAGTVGIGGGGTGTGGAAGSGGSVMAMGGEPGEPGAGGAEPVAGGAGGADAGCANSGDCNDDDPCTTDTCALQHCSYTASTAPCEDDDDPCTTDVCSQGACTHPDSGTCECQAPADCDDDTACTDDVCANNQCDNPDNGSCECRSPADCDDADPCTFNQCNAAGDCVYPSNGTCMVGTPFVVNNFNSSADWTNNLTTPGARALVKTGFAGMNLEGDANAFLAAGAAASLEMNVASLAGLGKLRIVIRCMQADTAPMVHVGTWNGTAWAERALSMYAPIPTATYATIEVPLIDLGQNLTEITKMRLRFAPTGGEKQWRIDEVSAAL